MEQVDVVLDPLRAFLFQVGAFLPRLGLALVVLLAGFLIAKAARFALEKGLRAVNLHIVTQRSGMDGLLRKAGSAGDTVDLFGVVVYWTVILAALIVAANSLGLSAVTDLLGRIMVFVPRLVVALLMLAFGSYFARFVGNAVAGYCAAADVRGAPALGRLARNVVLAFVFMLAIDQLDLGSTLIRDAFLIVLAGVVFALALAFGLGAREWAQARIEEWWPALPPGMPATGGGVSTSDAPGSPPARRDAAAAGSAASTGTAGTAGDAGQTWRPS